MTTQLLKDFYCYQCSLQFDKKSIYDIHLSILHKKDNAMNPEVIKSVPLLEDTKIESSESLPKYDLENHDGKELKNESTFEYKNSLDTSENCTKIYKSENLLAYASENYEEENELKNKTTFDDDHSVRWPVPLISLSVVYWYGADILSCIFRCY